MIQVQDLAGLVAALAPLGSGRDRTSIAVDGIDGAGKTSLARELQEALGGSVLSLDNFIDKDRSSYVPSLRIADIRRAIDESLNPLIIEGVCVLEVLALLGIAPTRHVYVKRVQTGGYWIDEEECDSDESVEELIDRLGQEAKAIAELQGDGAAESTGSGLTGMREEVIRYHAKNRPSQRADVVFLRTAAA